MTGNSGPTGSDLAFIDAYENTPADYDEIPDMSGVDPSLVTWKIGDRVVGEAEGRAAMAEALASHRERVELELGGDVLAAYRAAGPDWRERMVAALRAAAGL